MNAEHDVGEIERDAHQGILTAFTPRPWRRRGPPPGRRRTSRRCRRSRRSPRPPPNGRIAAHVVLLALLGVAQHVIRVRDELEALRGILPRVHVGVQLAARVAGTPS